MPAGLEATDWMVSGMGIVPWHSLGTQVEGALTAEEALRDARMGWGVKTIPLEYPAGVHSNEFFLNVREDTDTVLGVVGRSYRALQNKDAFTFFDKVVQDPRGPHYHTAGSLHGGKKIWLLAKLPDCIEVLDNDVIDQFLLLTHSHDGNSAIRMIWTPVRVVCQNTLAAALNTIKGGQVRLTHSGDIMGKVTEAQDVLGICRTYMESFTEQANLLLNYYPSDEQADDLLKDIFSVPEDRREKDTGVTARAIAEVRRLSFEGRGNDRAEVAGNGWGLYNGLTEFVDYAKPFRATENEKDSVRLDSVWFGAGAKLKARGLEVLVNAAMAAI